MVAGKESDPNSTVSSAAAAGLGVGTFILGVIIGAVAGIVIHKKDIIR